MATQDESQDIVEEQASSQEAVQVRTIQRYINNVSVRVKLHIDY